jgi:hypothetical protein
MATERYILVGLEAMDHTSGQLQADILGLLNDAHDDLETAEDHLSTAGGYIETVRTLYFTDSSAAYDLMDDAQVEALIAASLIVDADLTISTAEEMLP